MIAAKHSNLLIGVLNGFLYLGERRIREHLLGAPLMFSGVVLTAIFA